MNTQVQRIGSYLNHLVKARTRHAVHSPFVYDLIDRVRQDELYACSPFNVVRLELNREADPYLSLIHI